MPRLEFITVPRSRSFADVITSHRQRSPPRHNRLVLWHAYGERQARRARCRRGREGLVQTTRRRRHRRQRRRQRRKHPLASASAARMRACRREPTRGAVGGWPRSLAYCGLDDGEPGCHAGAPHARTRLRAGGVAKAPALAVARGRSGGRGGGAGRADARHRSRRIRDARAPAAPGGGGGGGVGCGGKGARASPENRRAPRAGCGLVSRTHPPSSLPPTLSRVCTPALPL